MIMMNTLVLLYMYRGMFGTSLSNYVQSNWNSGQFTFFKLYTRIFLQNGIQRTHCTKPAKATRRRIEFPCLVGKRRRPPAILFENIPRDQSRDEKRFCCSNGFVNKIGRVVGRDRQKIYWYIHWYISAWDDAERSRVLSFFFHAYSSFSSWQWKRLTMRLKMLAIFHEKIPFVYCDIRFLLILLAICIRTLSSKY